MAGALHEDLEHGGLPGLGKSEDADSFHGFSGAERIRPRADARGRIKIARQMRTRDRPRRAARPPPESALQLALPVLAGERLLEALVHADRDLERPPRIRLVELDGLLDRVDFDRAVATVLQVVLELDADLGEHLLVEVIPELLPNLVTIHPSFSPVAGPGFATNVRPERSARRPGHCRCLWVGRGLQNIDGSPDGPPARGNMVTRAGIEPATPCLKGRCSTD